jgi:hypothetical protein
MKLAWFGVALTLFGSALMAQTTTDTMSTRITTAARTLSTHSPNYGNVF